jgi:hypothetical protein
MIVRQFDMRSPDFVVLPEIEPLDYILQSEQKFDAETCLALPIEGYLMNSYCMVTVGSSKVSRTCSKEHVPLTGDPHEPIDESCDR